MRHWSTIFVVTLGILLTGCATKTIQSEVTAFHDWPAQLQNTSFAFERTAKQENNLEHRAYENLVRSELLRLGLTESEHPPAAGLKVALNYDIKLRDVRVVQPVVVDRWIGSPFWYGGPFYGPRWHGYGYYGPLYSPLWYPPIVAQGETQYQLANRQLQIVISRAADAKKLYDVTVSSEGTNTSLATVMPYMVQSAFADFPGKNGVPRRIRLKMKE
jgi:hypothetical protein